MQKKITKCFLDIKKELDWLTAQKGWKLINTNGFSYQFEQSKTNYTYEFVYFEKNRRELEDIKSHVDADTELVCCSSARAVFCRDASKGPIRIYTDNYAKYKMLMKKYTMNTSLGACYICLGASQLALSPTVNGLFTISGALFFICSVMFFMAGAAFQKYAKEFDDGTYAARLKADK